MLRQLAERIAACRTADPRGDRYRFLPPLSPGSLHKLEAAHRLALPADHRAFLLEVSAGGTVTRLGPPHLMTLRESLALVRKEKGRLDVSFPLGHADARRLVREAAKRGEQGPAIRRDISDGVLPLMDHGCGMLDLLVVSGPQTGKVWQAWEAGWTPLHERSRGVARQLTFTTWLLAMLDG
jgi:hypothetical protein